MKKVAIPVLAAVVACPAMAGQYHSESFWDSLDPYMALRVGAGYSNLNYRYDGYKESLSDQEMHARAALGLAMWCHRARTEIEWSMLTKLKDDNTGIATFFIFSPFCFSWVRVAPVDVFNDNMCFCGFI